MAVPVSLEVEIKPSHLKSLNFPRKKLCAPQRRKQVKSTCSTYFSTGSVEIGNFHQTWVCFGFLELE